jgi:hypothetical protein
VAFEEAALVQRVGGADDQNLKARRQVSRQVQNCRNRACM